MLAFLVPFLFLLSSLPAYSSVIPQEIRIIDLIPPKIDEVRSEYDHEAFLGKEQSFIFDHLSPEESKRRLGLIFEKIDEDQDGDVNQKELEEWIEYVQLRYIKKNVENQWKAFDRQKEAGIHWGEFKEKTYGQPADDESDREGFKFAPHMKRDLRRWQHADSNHDNHLSIEEFTDFLHPEESQHMKKLVIQETIEDMDKDKDGKISLEEYLEDLRPEGESNKWNEKETHVFKEERDKNKDGFLNAEEVGEWIMPHGYNHISSEAQHLIYSTDTNKDGKLSRQEVIDNFNTFVGSLATEYGEAIEDHDEF